MNLLKKILVVSVAGTILLFSDQIIEACSDFYQYDAYPQLYGNTAYDKSAYIPFNFVEGDQYYYDFYDDMNNEGRSQAILLKRAMISEWQNYTGSHISEKDIENFLYSSDFKTKADLQTLSSTNGFAQFLIQSKNKAALDYWLYAKKCEANALDNYDDWEINKTPPQFSNQTLKEEGLKLLKNEKNDFLRMKYVFQVLRMSFYDKEYDEVLRLYDDLLPASRADKSIAYARSVGFKAGAYYHKGDRPQAGYYYSKMFDINDAHKYEAMLSYEWSRFTPDDDIDDNWSRGTDNIESILDHCKNNHEKAVVKVMQGLRAYPDLALDDIREAYDYDPYVEGIDVLINREINKIERDYFMFLIYDQNTLDEDITWYRDNRSYLYLEKDDRGSMLLTYPDYIKELNDFIYQLISDNKNGSQSLWHLTRAYISSMMNQPEIMNIELMNARNAGLKPAEESLYNVVSILHNLYKTDKITATTEAELLPLLQKLDYSAKSVMKASYQFRDIMINLVGGKYLNQGDTTKAIYAMAHAVSYDDDRGTFKSSQSFLDRHGAVLNRMSISELNKVQDFRSRSNKSDFEKWLVEKTYYTSEVLTELEGTKYLRMYDFKNAAKIFEKLNKTHELESSPFMPYIADIIYPNPVKSSVKHTKLSFSKRMAELADIIDKNPNDAGALYGYAVALYNISYYGPNADLTYYFRSPSDKYGYFKNPGDKLLSKEMQEHYRVYIAEDYFNRSAKATDDPELKAKALWGAAKCWNKRSTLNSESDRFWRYNPAYYLNALKSPYFKKLNIELGDTDFIKEVKGRCDYYADYLNHR